MSRIDNSDLQTRIAQIALRVGGSHGFVLAGGKTLQVHGLSDRPTQDVDLFTNNFDVNLFSHARQLIVDKLQEAGFKVETVRNAPGFARLTVTEAHQNNMVEVDLGIDWRSNATGTPSALGAVLSQDDAVASKTIALFNRAYPRDFIDFFNIVATGRYTVEALVSLAHDHDPGFHVAAFRDALGVITRLDHNEVSDYGVTPQQWEEITQWTLHVSSTLSDSSPSHAPEQ
ncbi:nucleotidyl transferase AbiEii/AbiGii toxin family protein [Corynebacterium mayonis]|uniref:nucleotidyl transferase AbiEii/AbiGii toxin family protein n=1 Tax=Corynebacterium mayonis TaxID=3062461 RepID=UPI003140AEEE